MPHPIPSDRIVPIAVRYLSHRQLQGRSTTLREFCKRMGLGKGYLFRKLEEADVEYVVGSEKIVLANLPDALAEEVGIDNTKLYESYLKMNKESDTESEELFVEPAKFNADSGPYGPYRISQQEFNELKKDLIPFDELVRIAKIRGYTRQAIYRAVGGPKMRYELAGPLWRPYVYENKKYYASEVTRYLSQSDRTYKNRSTASLKKLHRQQKPETA